MNVVRFLDVRQISVSILLCWTTLTEASCISNVASEVANLHMRVVLKVLVFGLYLGDHFSWFKRLAKVSRKKTRKDYTFSRKMCDSSVVQ